MPGARAQTTKQAKASYKNSTGAPRLTERERKQLERNIVLQDRADKEQERESRRQWAIKQKAKREEKEKELRQQAGMGLATQLAGYSHTQKRMKSAMEGFLNRGKVEVIQEKSATDSEVLDFVGDPDIDDFDADTIVLGQDLTIQKVANVRAQPSPVLALAPIESPAMTSRTRGPFRASQSFGDGLDDESLMEAESQSANVITVIKTSSPPRPVKRLHDDIADDHTEAIRRSLIVQPAKAPPAKLQRLEAKSLAPSDPRIQTATSATFSAALASSMEPRSLDANQETQVRMPKPVSRLSGPMLDVDLDYLFPSNTQVAHELTPPKIVSSRTLLHGPGTEQLFRKHATLTKPSSCDGRPVSAAKILTDSAGRVDSGFSMPPPPRPKPPESFPRRSPKRDDKRRISAFCDFGLSTQLVHSVIEEDLELTDDELVETLQDPVCGSGGQNLAERETIVVNADDIDFDDWEADFG